MNESMRRKLVGLALCLAARTALAQGGESGTIVLEHPASARALGLGGATVAVRDGDGALFANPALVDTRAGSSASVSGQRYIAGSTLAAASAATSAFGGSIAVGLRGLNYGSVNEYVPDTINFGGQRGIATGRDVTASEFALTAGFARAVSRVRIGGAVTYVRQQIADESGGTASLDVGVATDVARGITLGVAVQHIGSALTLATTPSPLPRLVRAGVSVPFHVGALGALVAGEAVVRRGGDVVPRGGAELWWRTANAVTLTARAGARGGSTNDVLSRFTYGGGIAAAHVALDYAYQGMAALGGGAHRVGVRFQR
jgi:hypothetical protein